MKSLLPMCQVGLQGDDRKLGIKKTFSITFTFSTTTVIALPTEKAPITAVMLIPWQDATGLARSFNLYYSVFELKWVVGH